MFSTSLKDLIKYFFKPILKLISQIFIVLFSIISSTLFKLLFILFNPFISIFSYFIISLLLIDKS